MFLIFDTETTGLIKDYNATLSASDNWPHIVQIAWQLHDEYGQLIENQDYIIKPEGFDIPFSSTRIHGITTEIAHEHGENLKKVLLEFLDVLNKTKYIVGQNLLFDVKILLAELFRNGVDNKLNDFPILDTMLLGTNFCKLPGGKSGKYKSPKLQELFEKLYGTSFEEAHNAAADVNATAQVFFEMMRIGVVNASDLKVPEDVLKNFRSQHPQPIQPFSIKIRNQVEQFKLKRTKKVNQSFDEIELGDYFNFHNHSIFSSLQSTTSINQLIDKALINNFPAVGLVDLGNLMGAYKFISEVIQTNINIENELKIYLEKKQESQENATEFNDPKPREKPLIGILGCEFYISDRPTQKQFTKDDPDIRTQVILLAKNLQGYKNLSKLSSLGYTQGFYFGVPRISREMIAEHKNGLIALSGGINGDIAYKILQSGEQKGEKLLLWWKECFGEDFYVQIQNHNIPEEDYLNNVLLGFCDKHDIAYLAQNETYYTEPNDAAIQDILYCIKDGEKLSTPKGKGFGKRKSLDTNQFYIKDKEHIKQSFQEYPDAFEKYTEFLNKFENYTLKRDVLLPKFEIPEEFQNIEDEKDGGKRGENAYLKHLAYEGAKHRYQGGLNEKITERIEFELAVIANTGYPGYFLIVQDFCKEARKMGVSVGPGRGSAAGSVVAYCTGITNVDPIKYDLLFERFLNPERISMPDIDIDFDDEGRDKIIRWVIDKYGKNNVAQIITYSVLGGKSAIKDAARVLDISIPESNAIAKLIPSVPGMNIEKSFKKYDKLSPEDKHLVDEMKKILENKDDHRHQVLASAKKLEGAIRNTGIHACGVIITPEDISNLVPITIAGKDTEILVSQFDNSVAENAGLLKMDFLGLRTLSIIKNCIKLIQKNKNINIDLDQLSLEDTKTFELFQEGKTIGIFQYESPGMQKYMRELKPNNFADLIAMNALYRPGPIKYIPNFINRKHGIEETIYDLEETEEFLAETYGITVYQEQVMLLSQKLANFTKGEADNLRKAMGKKDKKVLDKMYPKFIEGGTSKNLDVVKLNKIWKDWEAFAEYAFNKSHSTCYALIAYQTAYLKANYTAEYMASVMTHNLSNTKQITMFMEDCQSMGIDVLGPDVNESQYEFSVNENGQIRFGLGAIKGIGEGPSASIVKTRAQGKFLNVFDFFEKIPTGQINKKVVESLIVAGAFDELDQYHRAQYFQMDLSGKTCVEKLLRYGQSFQESKNEVENSLFADFAEEIKIEPPKIEPAPEWSNMHKLGKEKDIIGFYLSAHPLDEFKHQHRFLQGAFSKIELLDKNPKENESTIVQIDPIILEDDDMDTIPLDVIISDDLETDLGEVEEKSRKKIEPKGSFSFINLDEMEALRDQLFSPEKLKCFDETKNYKEKQEINNNSPEFTVSGIITEFTVRDGKHSGEKVAFITLEDYSGSYSFRLGDKDYMKFRQYLDVQRFVILKIKFSIAKDLRIYVNISDVFDLNKTFNRFVKSLSIILKIKDFKQCDLDFINEIICKKKGEQKLQFLIKNFEDFNYLECASQGVEIEINENLIETLQHSKKFQFFLN